MASTDREALIALFRSTGGAGWERRDNWDTDAVLATWDGVEVNDQGRVVGLDLSSNNLQGLQEFFGICCLRVLSSRDKNIQLKRLHHIPFDRGYISNG
ncbi:unnamed protein product [Ectocarpus sp. 8 AP-2014]